MGEKNYEDFINDLLKANNAKYEVQSKQLICDNPEDNDYFFGTILLVVNDGKTEISNPYIIVDGQQRLTTMTLFFSAIKNIIEKIDKDYRHSFDSVLLVDIVRDGKSYQHARLQNRKLTPILPVNILNLNDIKNNGTTHDVTNKSQEWLLESYEIINDMLDRENIAKRLSSSGKKGDFKNISDENYISFIDHLGRQILNSAVISIYSESEHYANILYRNFNYRGKPLGQSDLIKNEIFSILDDSTESAFTLWKEMETNIFFIDESINTFLFHYMASKYSTGTKNSLFATFNSRIQANEKDYTAFLNDILENSKYYKTIVIPADEENLFNIDNFFKKDNNPVLKRKLIFLSVIDATQVRILLLGLFIAMNTKKITSSQFKKIINIITNHQAMHVLAKSPANKLTPIYKKYSKIFREISKINVSTQIKKLENDLRNIFPSLETVIQKAKLSYDHKIKVSEMNSIQKKNRFLIKYILETLSIDKQSNETNIANDGVKFIYDATIEHIIDQENNSISNVKSLGNLILIEASKHTDSENKSEMYSSSEITMTKEFFKEYGKFISEKNIEAREKKIITDFFSIVKK